MNSTVDSYPLSPTKEKETSASALRSFLIRWNAQAIVVSGLLLFALGVMQFALLAALPYTTSLIDPVSVREALREPARNFALGPIRWDLESYAGDPRLEEFRSYFKLHCGVQTGLQAAICVSAALSGDIRYGNPSSDFLSAQYDPLDDFHTKLRGEPAYCVNFSSFLTNSLLSVQIPSRVVQFVPNTRDGLGGHTLVEVWDGTTGWTLIDPSNGGLPKCNGNLCSAIEAIRSPNQITFEALKPPANAPDGTVFYNALKPSLGGAEILYPEPWYYTRTGEHVTQWPFRATFILVGQPGWQFGPVQTLLRIGIVLSVALGIVFFLFGAWKIASRRFGFRDVKSA